MEEPLEIRVHGMPIMWSVTADRSSSPRFSDVFLRQGYSLSELPFVNLYLARERARRGDRGRPPVP